MSRRKLFSTSYCLQTLCCGRVHPLQQEQCCTDLLWGLRELRNNSPQETNASGPSVCPTAFSPELCKAITLHGFEYLCCVVKYCSVACLLFLMALTQLWKEISSNVTTFFQILGQNLSWCKSAELHRHY